MEWDDERDKWAPTWGYDRAGSALDDAPIVEVKAGGDIMADPWEAKRAAKKERVAKNEAQREKNEQRAKRARNGGRDADGDRLAAPKASELIKAAAARAKADPDAPEGLPVDMARKTHKGAKGVAGALARAQLATASLGNFDAMRRRSRRASAAPSGPRTATRPRASRASCPGSTRSRTATSARCCGSDARRTSGGAIRGARRGLAGVRLAGCRLAELCDAKWTTRR